MLAAFVQIYYSERKAASWAGAASPPAACSWTVPGTYDVSGIRTVTLMDMPGNQLTYLR